MLKDKPALYFQEKVAHPPIDGPLEVRRGWLRGCADLLPLLHRLQATAL